MKLDALRRRVGRLEAKKTKSTAFDVTAVIVKFGRVREEQGKAARIICAYACELAGPPEVADDALDHEDPSDVLDDAGDSGPPRARRARGRSMTLGPARHRVRLVDERGSLIAIDPDTGQFTDPTSQWIALMRIPLEEE